MKFRALKFNRDPETGKLAGFEVELEWGLAPEAFRMTKSHRSDEADVRPSELLEVLDALPELIATFDRDGRLLYLNAAGRLLLEWGGANEEIDNRAILLSDLYAEPDADRLLSEALSAAARDGSWSGPGVLLSRKGRRVRVRQHLLRHPVEDGKARAFTVVARADESREPNETASLVALALAFVHDLNNLLFPITAYASLAESRVGDSEAATRYLGRVQLAGRRAQELAMRMVECLRRRPWAREVIDLADVVRRVLGSLAPDFPQHRFTFEPPGAPRRLLGNELGLEEVVSNLCRNAAESLPPAGGTVTIRIDELEAEPALRLSVRDEGSGIDEANRSRIFEPFFTTKTSGTGLGLTITREIVRLHQGTISISSTPHGTEISVDLPVGDLDGTGTTGPP